MEYRNYLDLSRVYIYIDPFYSWKRKSLQDTAPRPCFEEDIKKASACFGRGVSDWDTMSQHGQQANKQAARAERRNKRAINEVQTRFRRASNELQS